MTAPANTFGTEPCKVVGCTDPADPHEVWLSEVYEITATRCVRHALTNTIETIRCCRCSGIFRASTLRSVCVHCELGYIMERIGYDDDDTELEEQLRMQEVAMRWIQTVFTHELNSIKPHQRKLRGGMGMLITGFREKPARATRMERLNVHIEPLVSQEEDPVGN